MPKTLLLADDSVVIQKLVALSFASEDVELISTDNGDDALARARELKPDLVLADVVMPGKNGYEVCEAIRQDAELRQTPVLLLTGTFEAFDAERAQQVGCDGHITKPFEAQALVDRVNELLSRQVEAPAATETAAPGAPEPTYDFFDEGAQDLSEAPVAAPIPAATQPPVAEEAFDFGAAEEPLAADPMATPIPNALAMPTPEPFAAPVPDPMAAPVPDPMATPIPDPLSMPAPEPLAVPAPAAGGDRTVAFMPDTPEDPLAPPIPATDAFDFGAGDPLADMDLPALADDAIVAPVGSAPSPVVDIDEAITADDVSFGEPPPPPTDDPAQTILADDLFSPPIAGSSDPLAGVGVEADFDLDAGDASDLEEASLLSPDDFGGSADLDAGSASAYDVSSSDLGDSFARSARQSAESQEPAFSMPAPEPPVSHGAGISLDSQSDLGAADDESAGALPTPSDTAAADSRKPDLTPMMRERVHETLEKVAWEAFADLSDTIVREVLKRVETVAWEVIPQMAESLIQDEIRRMKDEQD